MRVLVTGSAGYVGTVLTRALTESGHTISGVDAQFFRAAQTLDHYRDADHEPKDIRALTVADFRGVDAVIDLAALSNDPLGNLRPAFTYEINHLAAVRTARLARQAGVSRYIFSSSCSIYGLDSNAPLTETDPVRPLTPYAAAKRLAESDIAKLADDRFSPTILRNATVFGPSPNLRLDLVVNYVIALAQVRKEITLRDDGLAWRPFLHISDLSAAIRAVLEAPREAVHNEIFNVGSAGNCYRIREIAELVATTIPGTTLKLGKGLSHDSRSYQVTDAKIRERLPGLPRMKDVGDGIGELVACYKAMGLSMNDLTSQRFERLPAIIRQQRMGLLDDDLHWVRPVRSDHVPTSAPLPETTRDGLFGQRRLQTSDREPLSPG